MAHSDSTNSLKPDERIVAVTAEVVGNTERGAATLNNRLERFEGSLCVGC
jgi:hypothetical protein